ncbi:uncharacterized protein LOC134205942 [Armigeres subalbatus]|uniref:uncharacterized protein LOC134205942 n=1 Tax=Armigeres subalbatus TaxID=124917 RepID=UPI002ED683FD
MRTMWKLLLLVQLVMGEQNSYFCIKGFKKVLENDQCDYFAYGPHFMSSYCNWQDQLEYGITKTFCCGGVCAYCFQHLHPSSSSETAEMEDAEGMQNYSDEGSYSRSRGIEEAELGQILVITLDRMMEKFFHKQNFTNYLSSTMDFEDTV